MSAARIWIDGAARGNPGDAGIGVRVELASGEAHELAAYLGRTTNNVAEYMALAAALLWARELGIEELELHSDSELVVKQLTGVYKVKAPHLLPLFTRVLALRRGFPRFRARHVRRELNKDADRLANRGIDERLPPPAWLDVPLPRT
jgi:ribonuclease HI